MKGKLYVHTDGASKGNPGNAGLGAVISNQSGQTLKKHKEYIGETTNNVAEYKALISGLKLARAYKPEGLELFVDSELVFCQLHGVYKVRSKHLLPLYRQALRLMAMTPNCELRLVPREENKEADRLAGQAIKEAVRAKKAREKAESAERGTWGG